MFVAIVHSDGLVRSAVVKPMPGSTFDYTMCMHVLGEGNTMMVFIKRTTSSDTLNILSGLHPQSDLDGEY